MTLLKSLISLLNNLVSIETDVEDNLYCMMDVSKMKQVLMNLIMNAVDAMPDGGTVRISGKKQNEKVVLQVLDSGFGISEKQLDNIFNPFYTTKDKGTGLGLSITHKIIKDHNGSIKVKSTTEKGTEFIIELPNDREAKNEI